MENKRLEDEINYENLAKDPIRWFGFIYPYFVVVLLLLGIFYVKNIDRIEYNSLPPKIIEKIKFEDGAQEKGGFVPAVDLMSVGKPTDELLVKGKDLFKANCESCHGAEGFGDGAAGAALNPKPRNFHDQNGWTNGRTVSGIFKTLKEGIIANGMAAYEYISVEDRFAMIHYIRSLESDYPEVTNEELAALDKQYSLSADVYVPNKIPVSNSIKIISNEMNQEMKLLKTKFDNIDAGSKEFIESNTINNLKAVYALSIISDTTKDEFIEAISLSPNHYYMKNTVLNFDDKNWDRLYKLIKSLNLI